VVALEDGARLGAVSSGSAARPRSTPTPQPLKSDICVQTCRRAGGVGNVWGATRLYRSLSCLSAPALLSCLSALALFFFIPRPLVSHYCHPACLRVRTCTGALARIHRQKHTRGTCAHTGWRCRSSCRTLTRPRSRGKGRACRPCRRRSPSPAR